VWLLTSFGFWFLGLTPKVIDEICEVTIIWRNPGQALSVIEGGDNVSRIHSARASLALWQ
jgi:hypothetical protein